jgi:hypothetical protein
MDKKHKAAISFTLAQVIGIVVLAFGWIISVEGRLIRLSVENNGMKEVVHEIKTDLGEIKSILMKGAKK